LQCVADVERGFDDLAPGDALAGIEVEDDPVGGLEPAAEAPQVWNSTTPNCASAR
jgi:hypothetical protein